MLQSSSVNGVVSNVIITYCSHLLLREIFTYHKCICGSLALVVYHKCVCVCVCVCLTLNLHTHTEFPVQTNFCSVLSSLDKA